MDAIAAIETTDNHPFFVADRGWTRVDALAAGDLIPSADGTMLTMVSTMWTDRIETVYNLIVVQASKDAKFASFELIRRREPIWSAPRQ